MSLALVVHVSTQPALYGALAAAAAHAKSATLLHRPVTFTPDMGADAQQHVAAEGALVPSGLLWFERLTGLPVPAPASLQDIVAAAQVANVVVPWHPPVQDPDDFDELLALAAARDVPVSLWQVEEAGDGWQLVRVQGDDCPEGRWCRDALGRFVPTALPAQAAPEEGAARPTLRLALIGAERDQRDVYPANLACLADAADALGMALDVRFVDPRSFRLANPDAIDALDAIDGVVLPGGSDMRNVPGQLAVAQHTLAAGIPTLGLCLGMQTMSTALVRSLPGAGDANLAEADPHAPLKSFVPLADTPGLPVFRLGDQPVTATDPFFAGVMGDAPVVRCNHRFGLNPVLVPLLREHGMRIAATDVTGQIVDAIGNPAHPFFWGMQGHPELTSSPRAPHPLVMAFLSTARRHAGRGS